MRKYIAKDGQEGGKKRCHGADADDLIVKVPEGTVLKDFETGKVIADMSGDNQREVILRGGRGGLGEYAFCNIDHAGAQVRAAGAARRGAVGAVGA